jgi:hypothetical protein
MKYSHSKAMAVFYKIVKLVKNGVLMIIHIYDGHGAEQSFNI